MEEWERAKGGRRLREERGRRRERKRIESRTPGGEIQEKGSEEKAR